MKLRRMCKVNKAACAGQVRDGSLNNAHISGIVRLTSPKPWWIVRHIILYIHARLPLRQTSSLKGRRHFQSPGPSGLTPPLSTIRLLRSPRPGSAQIRDVARAEGRRLFDCSGGQRVWIFPPDHLPGPKPVSERRIGRTFAPQARPQAGAQTQAQCACPSSGTGQRPTGHQTQRTGPRVAPALSDQAPPPDRRKGLARRGKKGASQLDMKAGSTPPAAWTERYEALREHVLKSRQSLSADPLGLVLVRRQGVATWMRSWREVSSGAAPQASCAALPAVCWPDWQRQLTKLLAQMTSAHLSVSSTP